MLCAPRAILLGQRSRHVQGAQLPGSPSTGQLGNLKGARATVLRNRRHPGPHFQNPETETTVYLQVTIVQQCALYWATRSLQQHVLSVTRRTNVYYCRTYYKTPLPLTSRCRYSTSSFSICEIPSAAPPRSSPTVFGAAVTLTRTPAPPVPVPSRPAREIG